jgi:hypothetical protein
MATVMSRLRAPFVVHGLGILALFNLAVAHPLYEVLAGSPEFFVAHRASPEDLWLLAAIFSVVLPVGMIALVWIADRISKTAGTAVLALAVGLLCTALALQAFEQLGVERALPAFAGAAMAGIGALIAYLRVSAARTYVALLGPAVLAVPILFLARPSIRVFAFPHEESLRYPPATLNATPPIVLIVFDQLPLASLLDADGLIDRKLYPAFAGLADEATWFRNATAVAASTGSALPPIVTGIHPRRNTRRMAAADPNNLFTYLSGSYRMNVVEPITSLCPASVCPQEREGLATRLWALGIDVTIVYLHVLAPRELEAALPPVDQNWKNFAADQPWHRRWVEQRDLDRREGPRRFIDGIEGGGDRPTFHFLHALLPHEPYIYARTGQAFGKGTALPGLAPGGYRWGNDEWIVGQNYQAHLVQLGYVDALLGRILARLKSADVFDRALVIVTSDHGASFQPDRPFKGVTGDTAADIMAVPLLVKTPGQRAGRISDRNVEAVDIAPTIASVLGGTLPWSTQGTSALDAATAPRPEKSALAGAERHVVRDPEAFPAAVRTVVARKLALFRDGDPHAPLRAPHPDLVGRDISELRIGARWDGPVVLKDAFVFTSMDPTADFVPARLEGQAYGVEGTTERLALAVAVNNRVRATTLTAKGDAMWSALVPLDAFRPGRNDVRVFVIEDADGPVLRAVVETRRPPELDLISGEAKHIWGVRQSGLYPREFSGSRPFYWTDGTARLVTPLDSQAPPVALKIDVSMTGRPEANLRVLINGCELFRGPIPGTWSQTFSLESCRPGGTEATIELLSDTFTPGEHDARRLGVALDSVTLVSRSSQ